MTNRVVFALVAKRAEEAQAKATSLSQPVKFETAAGNILYAANRIAELEAKMEIMERIIDEEWGDCDSRVAQFIRINKM